VPTYRSTIFATVGRGHVQYRVAKPPPLPLAWPRAQNPGPRTQGPDPGPPTTSAPIGNRDTNAILYPKARARSEAASRGRSLSEEPGKAKDEDIIGRFVRPQMIKGGQQICWSTIKFSQMFSIKLEKCWLSLNLIMWAFPIDMETTKETASGGLFIIHTLESVSYSAGSDKNC
jgi:hypothetical protein